MKASIITKKFILNFVLALAFILACFGTIFVSSGVGPAWASSTYYVNDNTSSLSNPSFNSTTDSKAPATPASWSVVNGGSSSIKVAAGVIDTGASFNANQEKYKIDSNPGTAIANSADHKVLMINAKDNAANYGYKNTSSITLNANSYYKVTIYALTTGSACASIYNNLGTANSAEDNFVAFTSTIWDGYTFYFATDSIASSTLNLELWLGSNASTTTGAAFFDNITITQVSNNIFYDVVPTNNIKVIDLRDNNYVDYSTDLDATDNIKNGNFESFEIVESVSTPVGWEFLTSSSHVDNFNGVYRVDDIVNRLRTTEQINNAASTNIADDFMLDNAYALLISNKDNDFQSVKSTSFITIPQHSYYRLSFYAKTGNLSTGPSVTLTEVTDDENPKKASIETIDSSSKSLAQYNGFAECVFYIQGSPYKDTQAYITISLGSSDDLATGWAIFDDFTLQQISYANFSSKSATSNMVTNYLAHSTADTETILNGTFNFASNKDASVNYPLAPTSWTTSNDNGSGIISVNGTHFNNNCSSYGLTYDQNPGAVTTYSPYIDGSANTLNNVLMVRNNSNTEATKFLSTSFDLPAATSADAKMIMVEVYIKTIAGKANINLRNSNGILVSIENIESSAAWTKYTLYFKNGVMAQTLNLEVGCLGLNSYAFFDYVKYTDVSTSTTVTEDSISELIKSNNKIAFSSLQTDSFYSTYQIVDGVGTPINYTYSSKPSTTRAGVVDLDDGLISGVVAKADSKDSNVLMIYNPGPDHFHYSSNNPFALSEGSYYKFSIWVLTKNISGETEDASDIGATIELVGVPVASEEEPEEDEDVNASVSASVDENGIHKFIGISQNAEDNNGWTEYNFYIHAESSYDVTLNLGLGLENSLTQGYVLFDDIDVTDITEEDYTTKQNELLPEGDDIADYTTLSNDNVILAVLRAEEEEEAEGDEDPTIPVNYWMLIPSIILGLALVVAIVGYCVKRVPFARLRTRKSKGVKIDLKSLEDDSIKRELQDIRDAKLKDIKEQSEAIVKQQAKNKQEYENALKTEDNMDKREKMFNKYAKEKAKLDKQLASLESAKKYLSDEILIRAQEVQEIKARRKQYEIENEKRKKQLRKDLNADQDKK